MSLVSPALAGGFFTTAPPRKPALWHTVNKGLPLSGVLLPPCKGHLFLPGVPGRKQNECSWKRAGEGTSSASAACLVLTGCSEV